MSKFAILIKPFGVYVKAWGFFVEQGGTTGEWGRSWTQVEARDIEAARRKGLKMRDAPKRKRHNFKAAAARNAEAFASTKSKDGMYPI